jgi:hypothetical protein
MPKPAGPPPVDLGVLPPPDGFHWDAITHAPVWNGLPGSSEPEPGLGDYVEPDPGSGTA